MKSVIFALALVAGLVAQASDQSDYLTISRIDTTLVREETGRLPMSTVTGCGDGVGNLMQTQAVAPAAIDIDQIINIGKILWSIIKGGEPVANINTDVATALPHGVTCWNQLANWREPQIKVFNVSAKNKFGSEVVTFDYRVNYVYGGNFNGQGAYVAYASLEPVNVRVAWGYKLDATGNVPAVYNIGTHDAPVGAMEMKMDYKMSTVLVHTEASSVFLIDGTGQFKQLN